MIARPVPQAAALLSIAALFALAVAPTAAHADPDGGTVVGNLVIPNPAKRGEPAAKGSGFVKRARNPLKPPKAFNPIPYLVVVLEGNTVPSGDQSPPGQPVEMILLGHSFEQPLLPVMTGGSVEIKNKGRNSPRLHTPSNPDLVPSDPINPRGTRLIKKFPGKYKAIEIRDHDTAHLSGHILGIPHPYFSALTADGKFTITGVPKGVWKVRIWFKDGWLDMREYTVDVPAKRTTKPQKITLPDQLKVKAASEAE
jgi:hypothetical protein